MATNMHAKGGVRTSAWQKMLAVMLTALLGMTACSSNTTGSIGDDVTPLSETTETEQVVAEEEEATDPAYSQTLEDGTVVSSDDMDVSTLDISVSATNGDSDPAAASEADPAAEPSEAAAGDAPEAGATDPAAPSDPAPADEPATPATTDEPAATDAAPAPEAEPAAPATDEPAASDVPAIDDDLLTAPVADTAADASGVTVGGLIVSGGTQNTDYKLVGNTVQILTSTPLTFSNVNKSAATNTNIQVNAGVHAWITLDGVNIATNTAYTSPINVITNSSDTANGAKATNYTQVRNKTSLHVTLADGSTNVLNGLSASNAAGLRCGAGSELVIDDARHNIDKAGNPVVPVNGLVPADLTLKDGTKLKKGDPLHKMDSAKPGSLTCYGGPAGAGIGGGGCEDSGSLTIEGGVIAAYGYQHTTQSDGNYNRGSAGIGGGTNGGGTNMYFNGGIITAHGAYHASGIGAGYGNQSYVFANGANPAGDAIGHTSSVNKISATYAGNIYINGGFIKSTGGTHGNAFGQGCVSNNTNYIIKVTGGTLLPTSPSGYDIGGSGGYAIILGGSVRVASASKFQGNGGTAYNTQGITTWADITAAGNKLPDSDKVDMVTIDMTADLKKDDASTSGNNRIDYWELLVAGVPYNYGAPAQFDNGKLYLWLPKSATAQQITVNLKYRSDDNQTREVEPLYREAGAASNTTLKRYVDFEMDKKYTDQLVKPYDGLPFDTYQIDVDHPLETPEVIGGTTENPVHRTLTDGNAVTYKYQQYSERGGAPIGAEVNTGKNMPSDTGVMKFTMTSTQYSNTTGFKESYWGHRATGWCEITPVPAVLTLEGAEWGNLSADGKTWKPTTTKDDEVGNRIKVTFSVRSAIGTAPTCKTPTGQVQLKIDGKDFGAPITLTKEAVEKSKGSTYTVTEGARDASANTEAGYASPDNRWTAHVVYYMDPALADGLLSAKPSKFKTVSKSDEAQGLADVLSSALDDIMRTTADAQAFADGDGEEEKDPNAHKITAEYLPDKNYIEGVELNPQNADATATIIIPVDTPATITDDQGTKYEFTDEAPKGVDPVPGVDDGSVKYTDVVKNYSDFHKKDANGNETKAKDWFALHVDTKSAMPMEWTTSDPAVADFEYDENGNVVLDANGDPIIHVNSCGAVVITMHQPGNAVYNEQTRVIAMTVIPDQNLKPETEARVVMQNLTHPGLPAAPGDEIEYTIVGSNLTEGSSWQNVNLGDMLPANVTVDRNSFELVKNFGSPEDLSAMTAEDLANLPFAPTDDVTMKFNRDGSTSLTTNVGSIYGGQSTALRFKATVSDDIVDRAKMNGDNPPVIPNEPQAEGTYGVLETKDLVPGTSAGDGSPKPVDDTKIYGIAPEDPEAQVIAKDPKMEGPDAEVYTLKTAENLDRQGGTTLPGDKVRYTITVGNKAADSCLYYPVIHDTLPAGVVPVPGTFVLTRVDGTQVPVDDKVFVQQTNAVALYVDDLYGGEETSLTFECTVTNGASYVENTAQTIGTLPSEKWRGENPEPFTLDPETPVVPDGPKASEVLGGELLDPQPADPDDPDAEDPAPGVTLGKVNPGSPLADAVKADPDNPGAPKQPTEDDPDVSEPIREGDVIVKFGGLEPPASPDDIAKELDRIIKEKVAGDPQATSVDIPVTIQRPNPEDPENPEVINVVVTVPITPELLGADPTPASPAIDPENPPVPGTPWTPDPSIPTEEYPWGDFDWEEFVEKGGLPQSETPEPASPGVLIPANDPDANADLKVDKTAENLTQGGDGDTYVGDRVRYTITVSNSKPGTTWFNSVVRDDLPQGVDIDMTTAKVITATGQEVAVEGNAYNSATRVLAVNIGDVPGGTEVKVIFEAAITEQAAGNDVGNKAYAYGTPPSKVKPEDLNPENRPQPGSAFNPPEGWDKYNEANPPLTNPDAAYPSKNAKDNGVRPASEAPQAKTGDNGNGTTGNGGNGNGGNGNGGNGNGGNNATGNGNGGNGNGGNGNGNGAGNGGNGNGANGDGAGSDDDGWGTGVMQRFLQLAQTGDPLVVSMMSLVLVAACAGIAIIVLAVRRRRTDEE